MNTFGAAVWEGGIRDGKGAISTKSGALDKNTHTALSAASRASPTQTRRS